MPMLHFCLQWLFMSHAYFVRLSNILCTTLICEVIYSFCGLLSSQFVRSFAYFFMYCCLYTTKLPCVQNLVVIYLMLFTRKDNITFSFLPCRHAGFGTLVMYRPRGTEVGESSVREAANALRCQNEAMRHHI
uniref:Uncharacterized protein n=1 Tax=Amblyomma tuberculatum TaxID=48802 RepID=A0A6M2E3C6_9ACAR